jgi:predicted metalloprotease with PDZ domain
MRSWFLPVRTLIAALIATNCFAQAAASRPSITISVDATSAPRKLLRARLHIPASPGPLTLLYPKWIPGEHAPDGPIADLAALHFSAAGKDVSWQRDPFDMFAFHITVPSGTEGIDASLAYLLPATAEGFSSGASATAQIAVISWNQLLFYPKGVKARDLICHASLTLPKGWRFGTALVVENRSGGSVDFKPVSLERLVDSPVIAGSHFKTVDLAPESPTPHVIDIAADSDAALEITDAQLRNYRQLVKEALALFGGHHYEQYHFLLSLSNHVAHFGLEHHESSDDRTWERAFLDENLRKLSADLLPHEFVHSWNGKYRRPAGLATRDYEEPMNTELLWVYEGLTEYLGVVLTERSGLWSADDFRQHLAMVAGNLDVESGRRWRPLIDTAIAAQLLYSDREDWVGFRRGVDFYDEGALIWLEVDTLIRRESGGRKSIEDFCRLFYGPPSGSPTVRPYDLDELIAALNRTQAHDWRAFFAERVAGVNPRPPLNGIVEGGWLLKYGEEMSPMISAEEQARKTAYFTASLGFAAKEDGTLVDVDPEMPAGKAGLAPGMKIVSVNGRPFSTQMLRTALKEGKSSSEPLALQAENAEFLQTFNVDYHGGERYPRLERDPAKPDMLGSILKPLAAH